MKFERVKVANFKSFDDCEVKLKDFNVVIGANASGKSNFVQIFRFLRDIQLHGLENAISLQGDVEFLINNNLGASQDFLFEVEFKSNDNQYLVDVSKQENSLDPINVEINKSQYQFRFEFESGQGISIKRIKKDQLTHEVALNERSNSSKINDKNFSQKTIELTINHAINKLLISGSEILYDLILRSKSSLILNTLGRFEAQGNISTDYFQLEGSYEQEGLLVQTPLFWLLFRSIHEDKFDKIGIFDFDPKIPKKATPITGKIDLEEDGSNLAIVLKKILSDDENKRKFTNLLTYLLPFIDSIEIEKFAGNSLIFSLKEKYAKNDKHLPSSLISDGTINIIDLVVALYFDKSSVAIIEEPERNIHPHLMSKVVRMMKEASQNKQIIITTHNPQIVKYVDLDDILLMTRDKNGFSQISRPADKEAIKIFLENEIGIEELYVQNLLDMGDN